MKKVPASKELKDPSHNELDQPISVEVEQLPEIWRAIEAAVSPELALRRQGVKKLSGLKAAHGSPLVAYFLATRIIEPDIGLRIQVVKALAEVLDSEKQPPYEDGMARRYISSYLAQMRTRHIFALLETADEDVKSREDVTSLLKECSYAGIHMADILSDRDLPVKIRRQAFYFIGRMGFLDAVPALERLAARLSSKLPLQRSLPGMPPETADEELGLFFPIKDALITLRAP